MPGTGVPLRPERVFHFAGIRKLSKPLGAESELVWRGRLQLIKILGEEDRRFQSAHGELLRELAKLGAGEFEGLQAKQLPPWPESLGMETFRLLAGRDSTYYLTEATNYGDAYNVAATVGLLNSLARAQGRDVRWLVLDDGFAEDGQPMVVAGPRSALASLVEEGLLLLPPTEEAEPVRRTSERPVLPTQLRE